MPRVRVAQPGQDVAKKHPRAFALYIQAKPDCDGTIDAEVLAQHVKQYGDAAKSAAMGDMSFEEFAALFSLPSGMPGQGNCLGYAALEASSALVPYRFDRRPVGEHDVKIQITHAGICHSDIHQVRNEWKFGMYPMVPGHEIVGIVTEVGAKVTAFKPGDRAGVGCMVNSCRTCDFCVKQKEEQFCSKLVGTYSSKDVDGSITMGGYSTDIVVADAFALRIPDAVPLETAAPLLCAGITVYSPLRHFGLDKPGMRIGVVGLGGLGHMAVKFAKAFGCHVTVISTSESKRDEATKVLGADEFIVSKDQTQLQAHASALDGIINTVSAQHDLAPLIMLLKADGKMVCVGAPEVPPAMPTMLMLLRRITVAGSIIGSVAETQEMLDFCAQHQIAPMCEMIPISYVNEAYDRVVKADVRYRFVIDVQGSLIA